MDVKQPDTKQPMVNQRRNKKYLETNENRNTSVQNLGDAGKILRGKFISIQAYLKKQEVSRINGPI